MWLLKKWLQASSAWCVNAKSQADLWPFGFILMAASFNLCQTLPSNGTLSVLKRKNLTPIYRASLLLVDSALFLRGVQWRISVLAVVVSAGTSAHPRIPHRSVFIETTCMQTYYFSQASCFLKAYCSGFVGCCSWKFIKFQRFGLNAQRPKARYLMTYKETAVDCLSPEPQTHPIRIRK